MTELSYTYTNPNDQCNVLEVVAREELHITVSDEQAVDSYNAEFSCNITLSREEAKHLVWKLMVWLWSTV